MKRLGTFTAALLLTSALTPVYAQQPAQVIGPVTPGNLPVFNSPTIIKDSGTPATVSPGGLRIRLNANQAFYVNGDSGSAATCGVHGTSAPLTCSAGNDSNNCLTPGAACLTSQHVVNLINDSYDSNGFALTINGAHCASSSCGINLSFSCAGAPIGATGFNFVGDYDNPTAVEVFAANSSAAISVNDLCTVSVDSIALADQGSAINGVNAKKYAQVDLRSVTVTGTWNTSACIFCSSGQSALLNILGVGNGGITNTIASTSTGQIFQATSGGQIDFAGQTVAIPSAITVGGGQALGQSVGGSIVGISSGTFTGSGVVGTTGLRCVSFDAYWGNVDPNTVFPGNTNCAMHRTFNSAAIVGPTTGGGTATLFTGSDTIAGKSVANGGTGASAAGATAVGNISGAAPVSCPSGITAGTVVVLNGIVTHC